MNLLEGFNGLSVDTDFSLTVINDQVYNRQFYCRRYETSII